MAKFLRLFILFLLTACGVYAQETVPIKDNSFLVEEAYNQEQGVVQHIGFFKADRILKDGVFVFTQEWPIISSRHQFSYSLPVSIVTQRLNLENVLLNYRYQLLQQKEISVAPRITVILPVKDRKVSATSSGIEFNIPISAELNSKWVMHVNAGGNFIREDDNLNRLLSRTKTSFSGLSFIYLALATFNILNEFTYMIEETHINGLAEAASSFTWNPGIRFAVNFSSGAQLVPGISFPVKGALSENALGIFKKIK
jgi:hypothetical protein